MQKREEWESQFPSYGYNQKAPDFYKSVLEYNIIMPQ